MLPGPVLGLDFGERRIGVALSDSERMIATGLLTIDRRGHPDYLAVIGDLIRRKDVAAIVVGYPERTDGVEKPGGKTEAVDAFIAELGERFGLPVYREDESFTSSLAAEILRGRKGRRRPGTPRDWSRAKGEIDRVAAARILQDWLDRGEPPA